MTGGVTEADVRAALDVALRAFDRLPVGANDGADAGDRAAFRDAVSEALGVVAVRAARRASPRGWPSYRETAPRTVRATSAPSADARSGRPSTSALTLMYPEKRMGHPQSAPPPAE